MMEPRLPGNCCTTSVLDCQQGRHNFLPLSLNSLLPFHLQKGVTGRPSLAPKKKKRPEAWGMHRDWILQRKAYNPKSSLPSHLQQSHVLTQVRPSQEGVKPKFLCGGTAWQPFLLGPRKPQFEMRTWDRVKRAAKRQQDFQRKRLKQYVISKTVMIGQIKRTSHTKGIEKKKTPEEAMGFIWCSEQDLGCWKLSLPGQTLIVRHYSELKKTPTTDRGGDATGDRIW